MTRNKDNTQAKHKWLRILYLFLSFVFAFVLPTIALFYQYDFFSKETKVTQKFFCLGFIVVIIVYIRLRKYINNAIKSINNPFVKCGFNCIKALAVIVLVILLFNSIIDKAYVLASTSVNVLLTIVKQLRDIETLIIMCLVSIMLGDFFLSLFENESKKIETLKVKKATKEAMKEALEE